MTIIVEPPIVVIITNKVCQRIQKNQIEKMKRNQRKKEEIKDSIQTDDDSDSNSQSTISMKKKKAKTSNDNSLFSPPVKVK
jgi:hypothetical protein